MRLEARAVNSAFLIVPHVIIMMDAQHSIPPLTFHDFSQESFTFNFTFIIYTHVRDERTQIRFHSSAYRLLPPMSVPPLPSFVPFILPTFPYLSLCSRFVIGTAELTPYSTVQTDSSWRDAVVWLSERYWQVDI
jgi:hypothetical protein